MPAQHGKEQVVAMLRIPARVHQVLGPIPLVAVNGDDPLVRAGIGLERVGDELRAVGRRVLDHSCGIPVGKIRPR